MKKQYKAVFLSPHLDDAVLSCGGTIAKLASEGQVLVLNIFTNYPDVFIKGTIVVNDDRYREEQNAASYLGFTSESLQELDAVFRRNKYRSPARLFDPIDSQDLNYVRLLSDKIKLRLSAIDYDSLYVPLGIGWHVDHILCHMAGESLFDQTDLFFYEDAPYCHVPHFTSYRIDELGSVSLTKKDVFHEKKFILSECHDAARYCRGLAFMKNLKPSPYRLLANIAVPLFLYKLMIQRRFFHRGENRYRLHSRLINITDNFRSKIDAICLYESQFRELFLNRSDCEFQFKKKSYGISGNSSLSERFWQISKDLV